MDAGVPSGAPAFSFCRVRMNEIIFVVSETAEGGYAAEALGHAIFTVADSLEELNEMVRDAVICHFGEEVCPSPATIKTHQSGSHFMATQSY